MAEYEWGANSYHGRWDDPERPVLAHTCEHGHSWLAQPDGGVSPSWGLAGTSVRYPDWSADRCPEPERVEVLNGTEDYAWADPRGVICPGCGAARLPWELLPGLSSTPWELYEEAERMGHCHEPPVPICGAQPVSTEIWAQVEREVPVETTPGRYEPRVRAVWTWVPLDEAGVVRAGAQLDLFAGPGEERSR